MANSSGVTSSIMMAVDSEPPCRTFPGVIGPANFFWKYSDSRSKKYLCIRKCMGVTCTDVNFCYHGSRMRGQTHQHEEISSSEVVFPMSSERRKGISRTISVRCRGHGRSRCRWVVKRYKKVGEKRADGRKRRVPLAANYNGFLKSPTRV